MTHRVQRIQSWRTLPLAGWLILAIYIDSILFTFSTMILEKGFELNASFKICDDAALGCIAFYLSTKVLLYYFFVEKVHIIRHQNKSRFHSKLWLFNAIVVLGPYVIMGVCAFYYRLADIDTEGVCKIGLDRRVLVSITAYEVMLNVYLTALCLAPLRKMYAYRYCSSNRGLRRMAFRTTVGACITTLTMCLNLSTLAAFEQEPGWMCLMLCNLDILLTVAVLHWATSSDTESQRDSKAVQQAPAPVSISSPNPDASGTQGIRSVSAATAASTSKSERRHTITLIYGDVDLEAGCTTDDDSVLGKGIAVLAKKSET
ncbi:hypothetical protein AAFC00_006177 [Neodothiora populina]